MILVLCLVLLVAPEAQGRLQYPNEPQAGAEGVCIERKSVSYTEYESRQVPEMRTEWCWDVTKFFRCNVVYNRWETVPVAKEREVEVPVCCEGYVADWQTGACDKIIEPQVVEEVEVPVAPVDAPQTEEVFPDIDHFEELANELFQATHSSTPPPFAPIEVHPVVEEDHNEEDNENHEEESVELVVVDEEPEIDAHEEPSIIDDAEARYRDAQAEAMGAQIVAIVAKELLRPYFEESTTEATDQKVVEVAPAAPPAASEPAAAPEEANPEVMAAEMIGIFAKEFLKNIDNHPANTTESVVAEATTAVDTVPPSDSTDSGSTASDRAGAAADDGRPYQDASPHHGPSPSSLAPSSPIFYPYRSITVTSHLGLIECLLSAAFGFLACLVLLITLACCVYCILTRHTRRRVVDSNVVCTAVRPVVVP